MNLDKGNKLTKRIKHICDKEKDIAEIHVLVKEVHRSLRGNGQPGLVQRFNQLEGWVGAIKYLIGPGALVALVLAVIGIGMN